MADRPRYRTALITGASSGIGHALALTLAEDGVEVVACARRAPELDALCAQIGARGGKARPLVLDVGELERTVAAIRALDDDVGGLDLVIANAGVGLGEGDPHGWEALRGACHVNFTGSIATLTAILPAMKARGRGHLVGVSSLASFGALPGAAAYCSPKAGLSMFLDCLRLDLRGSGVAVTTVHPGFVRTPMIARSTHPMPQMVEADAAARLIWRRLQRRPARIDFPQPLAWLTRIAGGLPRWLHDLVMRLVPGVRP
jgi:NAD(P)-dependent dehydrogenase (short-subunit alcohol dehydrogenase family)